MQFDTRKLARELGISDKEYQELAAEIRKEFSDDEMMFELHLLRALRSRKNYCA